MIRFAQRSLLRSRSQRKGSILMLALIWVLGLACGLYIVSSAGDFLSSLMSVISAEHASIVGLAVVLFLPLAITAFAAFFSSPAIIYLFCGFKAICLGCCLGGVTLAFGCSAWLIWTLLFFSNSASVALMLWLWYRYFCLGSYTFRRDLMICIAAAVAVGIIDHFLVSPYLAMLINYS